MPKLVVLALAAILFMAEVIAGPALTPLVDTEWLASHQAEVVILDVRKDTRKFDAEPPPQMPAAVAAKALTKHPEIKGHIPGARLVDFKTLRTKREIDGKTVDKMIPAKAEFEALMQALGINKDSTLVIVTDGLGTEDLTMGTRLYWQLKYFGHDPVAILDGGTARWFMEGRELTNAVTEAPQGDWVAATERAELLASSADVAAAAADGVMLVDSRPVSQYLGTGKRDYVSDYGHIPGAKNYPMDLITGQAPGSGFLPPSTYGDVAGALGLDLSREAITYCNSGHLASGTWFVMSELLGNKKVKVYDGSMHEWTLEQRPVNTMRME